MGAFGIVDFVNPDTNIHSAFIKGWNDDGTGEEASVFDGAEPPYCNAEGELSSISEYTATTVDAVLLFAYAIEKILREDDKSGGNLFRSILSLNSSIDGVSDENITFDKLGDRMGKKRIVNLQVNGGGFEQQCKGSAHVVSEAYQPQCFLEAVATYDPVIDSLQSQLSAVRFPGGSRAPPSDEPPQHEKKIAALEDEVKFLEDTLLVLAGFIGIVTIAVMIWRARPLVMSLWKNFVKWCNGHLQVRRCRRQFAKAKEDMKQIMHLAEFAPACKHPSSFLCSWPIFKNDLVEPLTLVMIVRKTATQTEPTLENEVVRSFLEACMLFMDNYVKLGLQTWYKPDNGKVICEMGSSPESECFDRIYQETTLSIISSKEKHWYEEVIDITKRLDELVQRDDQRSKTLDDIEDDGQRLLEMYVASKPLKKNFEKLLLDLVDEKFPDIKARPSYRLSFRKSQAYQTQSHPKLADADDGYTEAFMVKVQEADSENKPVASGVGKKSSPHYVCKVCSSTTCPYISASEEDEASEAASPSLSFSRSATLNGLNISHHAGEEVKSLEVLMGPIKSLGRVLEKIALRGRNYIPWDVVRAMLVVSDLDKACKVLGFFEALATANKIHILCVNNRFETSIKTGGWSDISFCIAFPESDYPECKGLIAEVQIVHRHLLLVREKMGAHDAYQKARLAAELFKLGRAQSNTKAPVSFDKVPTGLPWSLAKKGFVDAAKVIMRKALPQASLETQVESKTST
eukprot:gnl/MRDRNA2_/MRDRNA2_133654_c0_seq1.p1 gnl/MRDRNA2_/MRDRNA2_133654_c0~~gnl/MRDRNA2_/MRDRNA2_133654_c0_seq1.p1  ORF type:complete len:765 (-),score=118.84 gnl/MRDRNA2_/MRDRNA2_133654_c0_seq1:336-2564(-)